MSAAGVAKRPALRRPALARARQSSRTGTRWCGAPARGSASRRRQRGALAAIAVAGAVAIVAARCCCSTAAAIGVARGLPLWLDRIVQRDHRFRPVRLVPRPDRHARRAGRRCDRCADGRDRASSCSPALVVRLGFLFLAIALPGLFVTIVKRLIGRARPLVATSMGRSATCRSSWRPDYASLPSGHGTTAFAAAIAVGALLPRRAAADVDLCRGRSRSAASSLAAHYPERRHRGGVVGALGALLVRTGSRRAGSASLSAPMARRGRCPGPSLARASKRLPGGLSANRSSAAGEPVARRTRMPEASTAHASRPCPWSCRCATRPAMSRPLVDEIAAALTGAGASRSSTSTTARPTAPRPR